MNYYVRSFPDLASIKALYIVNDEEISYSSKAKGYLDEKKSDTKTWTTTTLKFKKDMLVGYSVLTEYSGNDSYSNYYSFTLDKIDSTKVSLPNV